MMLGTVASRVIDAINQKNDATIFLPSGVHTKPKLKLTLTLALNVVVVF